MELVLFGYWLVLAAYTFEQAQYPGYEPLYRWQYPWADATITSAVLALLIVALYAITRLKRRPWRIAAFSGYIAVLLFVLQSTFITDQRGHFYVPGKFAAITLTALAIWGIAKFARGRRLAA